MSAFQVSDAHIAALVTAAMRDRYNMIPQPNWPALAERFPKAFERVAKPPALQHGENIAMRFPTELGRALLLANLDSLNARYPHHMSADDDAAMLEDYRHADRTLEPVSVIKQIHCFAYQACERDDWESSWAQAFCRKLETVTIARLPGYESAPWGIA